MGKLEKMVQLGNEIGLRGIALIEFIKFYIKRESRKGEGRETYCTRGEERGRETCNRICTG